MLILKEVHLNVNGKRFIRFSLNKNYYVSEYGDVYSVCSRRYINLSIDIYGYPRCDMFINGKEKHMRIHTLVYSLFVNSNYVGQINHYDDNKFNNYYKNLYEGTQQQNIKDCIRNQHRVGNIKFLRVYDMQINNILEFCPSTKFFDYCGHYNKNGSVKKFFDKKWFMSRYQVLEYTNIKDLKELKSVTTISDECS